MNMHLLPQGNSMYPRDSINTAVLIYLFYIFFDAKYVDHHSDVLFVCVLVWLFKLMFMYCFYKAASNI